MPGTWRGIGTTYYGIKDKATDGSFISTEWFVIFGIPLLPLGSQRVTLLKETHGLFSSSKQYIVRGDKYLDVQQVLTTYFLLAISIISGIWLSNFFSPCLPQNDLGLLLSFLIPILPYLITHFIFFETRI
jgi:hypothetical protein